jgi:hypothetical protein
MSSYCDETEIAGGFTTMLFNEIHWDQAVKGIYPFLERQQDVALLPLENLRNLLFTR